ncbi:hypothetical protein [Streptomyces sp. NPDC048172]|uniref:hypothetical protein n=1 Tax=Streptomyces sp. NPDC048172 TaxID=3365505 RepID=UPI0037174BD3
MPPSTRSSGPSQRLCASSVRPVLDDADLDLEAALQRAPRAPRAPLSLLGEVLEVSPITAGRRLARLESRRVLRVGGQNPYLNLARGDVEAG